MPLRAGIFLLPVTPESRHFELPIPELPVLVPDFPKGNSWSTDAPSRWLNWNQIIHHSERLPEIQFQQTSFVHNRRSCKKFFCVLLPGKKTGNIFILKYYSGCLAEKLKHVLKIFLPKWHTEHQEHNDCNLEHSDPNHIPHKKAFQLKVSARLGTDPMMQWNRGVGSYPTMKWEGTRHSVNRLK